MATDAEMQARLARYQEELPTDRDKAWALLESYSHIPADEIESHLRDVRDSAWTVFPYACIGGWRFLDLYVTALPVYPQVLARLKAGGRLLDAGCCFGHVLRQLAADGAPTDKLVGTDLRPEFMDLGYDLFRDRESFRGHFVAADMLAADSSLGLASLDGTFDMIHAASFFHLFSWTDQVRLGVRMVRLFRPEEALDKDNFQRRRLLFGRQVGTDHPPDPATPANRSEYLFRHSPATLQQLWDGIGKQTDTQWEVQATLVESDHRKGDNDGKHYTIQFAIYRLK